MDKKPKTNTTERRYFPVDEIRAMADEDGNRSISGHAAVFNKWSEDLGGFIERVAPGAFADTIIDDDIRSLFNHNVDNILGRSKSGTLKLKEDDRGLLIDNALPDTQVARDLVTSIDRGDIDQMSFGFRTIEDEWDFSDPKLAKRTLVKLQLRDTSPVTFPAYLDTDVAVRSLDKWKEEHKPEEPIHYRRKAAMRRLQLEELN